MIKKKGKSVGSITGSVADDLEKDSWTQWLFSALLRKRRTEKIEIGTRDGDYLPLGRISHGGEDPLIIWWTIAGREKRIRSSRMCS